MTEQQIDALRHELRCIRRHAEIYLEDTRLFPSIAPGQAPGNYRMIMDRCTEALRLMEGGSNG